MKHIIFTRFVYDEGNESDTRLEIMKNTLIECLHRQTNQNFIWSVMCKPHHREIIEKIYNKSVLFFDNSNEFKKFVNENKYEIQTRHDSDDIMCVDYVKEIQEDYLSNKFRNDAFLIEYQPMFFDIQNDRFYEFNIDYTESNSTSAFITLCPQNTTKTIWDHQHNQWVGNVSFIVRNKNRRCVAATVHGHNSTTNFNHKGKKLDQPFFFLP
jgi:hypothetical protein